VKTFLLWLSYDGTHFKGWQRQKDQRTVQATLERALQSMFGDGFRIRTSSRTDAGVHAFRHPVAVTTERLIPPSGIRKGLNALTPQDLAVVDVFEVPLEFSPKGCALSKTYRYVVKEGMGKDPFRDPYVWKVPSKLDLDRMAAEASCLLGEHDFTAFRAAHCDARTPVRIVNAVQIQRCGDEVAITITGNAFLRNMVRILAGSLVEVGQGRAHEGWLREVLSSRDRARAGRTAPARGLTLVDVAYPVEVLGNGACEW
jgi:tRNA pseudouridine38-40 synthase